MTNDPAREAACRAYNEGRITLASDADAVEVIIREAYRPLVEKATRMMETMDAVDIATFWSELKRIKGEGGKCAEPLCPQPASRTPEGETWQSLSIGQPARFQAHRLSS